MRDLIEIIADTVIIVAVLAIATIATTTTLLILDIHERISSTELIWIISLCLFIAYAIVLLILFCLPIWYYNGDKKCMF